MTKAAITFCGTCIRKVFKNPDCNKSRCPKKRGKFQNKKGKVHPWYNSTRWRKIRKQQLKEEPICKNCYIKGRATQATVVDHIKEWKSAHTESMKEFLFADPDNLQSLCASCHNSKTAKTKR